MRTSNTHRSTLSLLAFATAMALLGLAADVYRASIYGGTIRWALPLFFVALLVVATMMVYGSCSREAG